MNDGRAFTDYRSSGFLNDELRMRGNVSDSYMYRQYLIHNGLGVIGQYGGNGNLPCMDVNGCRK